MDENSTLTFARDFGRLYKVREEELKAKIDVCG